MLIDNINARLGEIDAELEALASLVDPTDEDAARAEALTIEAEERRNERKEALARAERITEAHNKAKTEGREIAGASFQHMQRVDAYATDLRSLDDGQVRSAALSILERSEARHLDDGQLTKVERTTEVLDSRFSRLLVSGSRPEYRSAFAKYIGGREGLLTNDERRAVAEVDAQYRAAGLADGSGGYAVPPLLDPSIILTSVGSTNPMRQVARIVTGTDDTWRGVSSAGITAAWDSQAVEVSDNAPTLAQPTVTAWKAQAFVPFSVEIEGDWVGMSSEMAMLFADAKDTLETTAFATGTGNAAFQPTGILTALFNDSVTASTTVTVTTDGQFGAVDVRAAFGALGPRYRANASWMASVDVQNEIRGFDTTGGLSNQTVDLTAPYSFALLGKPVYENSGFPDFTGTTGVANILAVGDFRNYVVFDRVGSRVEFVPHLLGNTGPTGQRGLWFWWRTGGNSVNSKAFKLLRNL
jgi:HK97 family phage major capsid protein